MSKKITVMAIDDEEDILFTLEAIGKLMKWNVVTVSDSCQAVGAAKKIKPDLILLDYHMPRQDGLTTLKTLRRWNQDVPILILTVDEDQQTADRFLEAGASDFANKPVKAADLAARINVHMRLRDRSQQLAGQLFCTKGINEATLELVRAFCREMKGTFLIEDVAEGVGLAYQTTVRYLHYLESKKVLAATSYYGKVGRPRKAFQYLGE